MEKIFIVDDDPVILKFTEYRLKKEGYDVSTATNGQKALEIIPVISPDIIITDMMMPVVDGLDIVRFVRNTMQVQIPVIVLSGEGTEDAIKEAIILGANDYITKPFNPNDLVLRVKRLLQAGCHLQ